METGSCTETGVEHVNVDIDEVVTDHLDFLDSNDKRLLMEHLINSFPDFTNLAVVRRTTQEYDYLQVFDRTPDWGHLNLLQLVLQNEGHQTRLQLVSCGPGAGRQRVVRESVSPCTIISRPTPELKLTIKTYLQELTSGKYKVCRGAFQESEFSNSLSLIDLKQILIEKNSSGIDNIEDTFSYRSRDCKNLEENGEQFCGPCLQFRQSMMTSLVVTEDKVEEVRENNTEPESFINGEECKIVNQRIEIKEELFTDTEKGDHEFPLEIVQTETASSETRFDPLITGEIKEEIHSPIIEQTFKVGVGEIENFDATHKGAFWVNGLDIKMESEEGLFYGDRYGMENGMPVDSVECEVNVQYSCNECDYMATTRRNLMRHQQSVHEGVKYGCDKCDFKATLRAGLKRHQQSVHEGVKYNCDQCSYQATQRGDLHKHKRSVHQGVKYECDQCDFKAAQRGYLRAHRLSAHEGIQYNCDRCDYTATKSRNLRRHQISVHKGIGYNRKQIAYENRGREEFQHCFIDPLVTGGPKEEVQSPSNEGHFNVDNFLEVNNEAFSRPDIEMKIEEEMIIAGEMETELPLLVECEVKKTGDSLLKSYDSSEFKAMPNDRPNTQHQSVQEGNKFICDKCDYKATSRHNLQRHQQSIHERVKFGCDKCDFKAARKDSLRRHQQSVHEGVKYKCDKCEYQASQRVDLRNHQQSIHEGVQYECNLCNFIGSTSRILLKHQQVDHKDVLI